MCCVEWHILKIVKNALGCLVSQSHGLREPAYKWGHFERNLYGLSAASKSEYYDIRNLRNIIGRLGLVGLNLYGCNCLRTTSFIFTKNLQRNLVSSVIYNLILVPYKCFPIDSWVQF